MYLTLPHEELEKDTAAGGESGGSGSGGSSGGGDKHADGMSGGRPKPWSGGEGLVSWNRVKLFSDGSLGAYLHMRLHFFLVFFARFGWLSARVLAVKSSTVRMCACAVTLHKCLAWKFFPTSLRIHAYVVAVKHRSPELREGLVTTLCTQPQRVVMTKILRRVPGSYLRKIPLCCRSDDPQSMANAQRLLAHGKGR